MNIQKRIKLRRIEKKHQQQQTADRVNGKGMLPHTLARTCKHSKSQFTGKIYENRALK